MILMFLNKVNKSFFLGSFTLSFLSSAFVSLVIPFLSDGPVDLVFLETIKHNPADTLGSLNQLRKGVDGGAAVNLLVILNKNGFTLGVSLRMPDLALVTGVFSFLGKRTSLLIYWASLSLFLLRVS